MDHVTPRLDASLVASTSYVTIAAGLLQTDLVVISHAADGTPRYGFVATRREAPLRDGFAAAFWGDGLLRHFGFYDAGACVSSIDLDPANERGLFQQGRTMRTGELYDRGTLETLSPWSDDDVARPTEQSYAAWVIEHVAAVRRAGDPH